MSLKLKFQALGLLASVAAACVAVSASAETGGHFVTTGVTNAKIEGSDWGEAGRMEFTLHGAEGATICETINFTDAFGLETEVTLVLNPTFVDCVTKGTETAVTVDATGCAGFTFRVAKGTTNATEQTAGLDCAVPLTLTHPNCTIRIPEQELKGAVTHTKILINGKHGIEIHVAVKFAATYEGGICVFLGTTHTGTINGAIHLQAKTQAGVQTPLTVT